MALTMLPRPPAMRIDSQARPAPRIWLRMMAKKLPKRTIRQQVAEIAVKAERGEGAPPFAVDDQAGIGRPGGVPVEAEERAFRRRLHEGDHRGEDECAVDHLGNAEDGGMWLWRCVLCRVFLQLVFGAFGVGQRDHEADPPGAAHQDAADAHGDQHERVLLGLDTLCELTDLDPAVVKVAGKQRCRLGWSPFDPSPLRRAGPLDRLPSSGGGRTVCQGVRPIIRRSISAEIVQIAAIASTKPKPSVLGGFVTRPL